MPSVPHPYLPSTDDQREEMLRAIGVAVVTDLFADIPEAFRDPDIRLPEALSELELRQDLEALAAENKAPGQYASFLGRRGVPALRSRRGPGDGLPRGAAHLLYPLPA